MSKAAEYFQIKMVLVDKEAVEKSGQAIFALEPHHVLPLSIFAFNNFLCGFEGHDMLGLLTGLCFKMPLMRHVYTWVNAHSVDKKDMLSLLKKGISPVLCPGGVQEVTFLGDETQCVLYLKKRTGLFKIALQHGTPVIPVFSFGLQNSFSFWIPKAKWIQKLGRKCGALPMMFFGVFGLPMGPAKPCQYVNVIGKPLPLPSTEKIANPTNEQIKQYQEMYIEEITRLFHDYQDEFGMAGVTLRIE